MSTKIARIEMPEQANYIKQEPYVGEDAIYWPVEEYALEGCASYYRPVLTKELFIEAYNKWIVGESNEVK